jgi:hypothetical protein
MSKPTNKQSSLREYSTLVASYCTFNTYTFKGAVSAWKHDTAVEVPLDATNSRAQGPVRLRNVNINSHFTNRLRLAKLLS